MKPGGRLFHLNQYKRLMSNTALFAISTFGSKVLVFLLMPFYTRVLSQADYGITDILIQTGNLLIPLASVGISNSIIRFGLEKGVNKSCVFTVGLITTLGGFGVLCLASPLFTMVDKLSQYTVFVLLYVLAANLHTLVVQFARVRGYVRLFAVDGIARTLLTILLNILLLVVFPCGVAGYVMANVIADLVTTIFVFLIADLRRYINFSALQRSTTREMLRYCVPLIPTMVCTWIINISDRYLVTFMIGDEANAIYAVATKIPTILLIVADIFATAWQLSALKEQSRLEKERFFSNVFGVYQSLAFLVGSGLILTAKISTSLLAAPDYFTAWQYIPVLVLSSTFACFSSFLSSVYMVEKRSVATLVTTMAGAALNLVGNFLLIPKWGIMGAAVSTMVSYFFMFIIRAIHTRTMLRIRWSGAQFLVNLLLTTLQCLVMEWNLPGWPIWSTLCLLLVVVLNAKNLLKAVLKILRKD